MSKLTKPILAIALFTLVIACNREERQLNASPQIVTESPPPQFSHWVGDSGILARFGPESQIGAIMHYGVKNEYQFVIFDATGKQFLLDIDETLSGPFKVEKLFKIIRDKGALMNGFQLDRDSVVLNSYAKIIDSLGVESAVYSFYSGIDSTKTLTIGTKNNEIMVLKRNQTSSNVEILDGKFNGSGVTSKSKLSNVEAMLYDERLDDSADYNGLGIRSTAEFYPVLIGNKDGNIVNGDNDPLGTVYDVWGEVPSNKIEAMCYFKVHAGTGETRHYTILVLGAYKYIPADGQFIYFIKNYANPNGNGSVLETTLVDLRK